MLYFDIITAQIGSFYSGNFYCFANIFWPGCPGDSLKGYFDYKHLDINTARLGSVSHLCPKITVWSVDHIFPQGLSIKSFDNDVVIFNPKVSLESLFWLRTFWHENRSDRLSGSRTIPEMCIFRSFLLYRWYHLIPMTYNTYTMKMSTTILRVFRSVVRSGGFFKSEIFISRLDL